MAVRYNENDMVPINRPGSFLVRYGSVLCVCILTLLSARCAPALQSYTTRILYQNDRFNSESFSNQTILLFPMLTSRGFDTVHAIADTALARALWDQRSDLVIYFRRDFEKQFRSRYPVDSLRSFYRALLNNEVVPIQLQDSAWAAMPARYVLIPRRMYGGKLKDYDGVIRRKVRIEAELWDSRSIEIVWRAEASGFEQGESTTDVRFIIAGMQELYRRLPPFRHVVQEENW